MENKWDSEKYLKFEKERTQPAIDLARRVAGRNVVTVLDVGCGPGNSSAVVKSIFPDADILGIDFSADMIERAKKDHADIRFEQWDADVFTQESNEKFDIWTTIYHHVLPSHEAIWTWYEGTGLRPYLSQIEDSMKEEFKKDIMEEIRVNYPLQKNNKVIFHFPRLFFVVEK